MQDANVDLWATDEVYFQQHGSRCRTWIPPEIKDPVLLHHAPTRKSVGYFGGVRLRDGRFVFRLENRQIQWAPASFSSSSNSAPPAAAPGDGLWSSPTMPVITTPACTDPWREQHAHHFALDFLPPYSPELNPIERVWKLTRRRCLHNRYFDNLQDVISAVESEFATWITRNHVLRRLCAIT